MRLGRTRLGMVREHSDPLTPPWPDLVLLAGYRSVSVARWIKRQSGGRTRLVTIGRPRAPLRVFDLVITTAQYGLPARENVLHNTLTLNRFDPVRLKQAAAAWQENLAHLPRPWTALLVGGDTRRHTVDADWARQLAETVRARRARVGGSLLVTTSPRTPAAVADVLQAQLPEPMHFFRWRADADNPYPAYLALADAFIVTGDSASMLSEACWTQKPVAFFAPGDKAETGRAELPRMLAPLVTAGLVRPSRNMAAFRQALVKSGLAHPLRAKPGPRSAQPPQDFAEAVRRIRALFPGRP